MTRPRSQLVSLDTTPYYHCISRCVRRAFLCGQDRFTGKSFDHRKPWLLERMALLESTFAINIAAYAVMSNHYHLVIHVDESRALAWTDQEVISRWIRLHRGPVLIQRLKAGEALSSAELRTCTETIGYFRRQLCNLSKFMACLNEFIARKANLEDGCTGHFWEGRFKSQALLDEAALISCMAYVDLNPIRAGTARDIPTSDFTSVQARTNAAIAKHSKCNPLKRPTLLPFVETEKGAKQTSCLPYSLKDYLELVDWTGRSIRSDKRGYISQAKPRLLTLLALSDHQWRILALDVQKQSILMFNGLNTLASIEIKDSRNSAA